MSSRASDRRLAEIDNQIALHCEKLISNNYLLKKILNLSSDAFWMWHVPSGYDWLSESWHQLLEEEVGKVPFRAEEWWKRMHPDFHAKAELAMRKHLDSNGKIPYLLTAKYITSTGKQIWLTDKGEVVEWDKEGNPIWMVGFQTLVTDSGLCAKCPFLGNNNG